uniref:Uncharacterized protein n=1 Tax=Arundo donax TaxID=35708 RepID=A0A0A9DQE7_ARUDO
MEQKVHNGWKLGYVTYLGGLDTTKVYRNNVEPTTMLSTIVGQRHLMSCSSLPNMLSLESCFSHQKGSDDIEFCGMVSNLLYCGM